MFNLGFVCLSVLLVPKYIMAVTDEQKTQITAKFLEVGLECIKDHPITSDDITAFREKKLPTGENASCFAACLFKAVGLMDENGNISHDGVQEKAKTIFTEEKELKNLEEFITTCVSVNDEKVEDSNKGCDRAKLAFNCLVENSEKFGFDFKF